MVTAALGKPATEGVESVGEPGRGLDVEEDVQAVLAKRHANGYQQQDQPYLKQGDYGKLKYPYFTMGSSSDYYPKPYQHQYGSPSPYYPKPQTYYHYSYQTAAQPQYKPSYKSTARPPIVYQYLHIPPAYPAVNTTPYSVVATLPLPSNTSNVTTTPYTLPLASETVTTSYNNSSTDPVIQPTLAEASGDVPPDYEEDYEDGESQLRDAQPPIGGDVEVEQVGSGDDELESSETSDVTDAKTADDPSEAVNAETPADVSVNVETLTDAPIVAAGPEIVADAKTLTDETSVTVTASTEASTIASTDAVSTVETLSSIPAESSLARAPEEDTTMTTEGIHIATTETTPTTSTTATAPEEAKENETITSLPIGPAEEAAAVEAIEIRDEVPITQPIEKPASEEKKKRHRLTSKISVNHTNITA